MEKVLKWLQEIKGHYGCFQDEAGPILDAHSQYIIYSACLVSFLNESVCIITYMLLFLLFATWHTGSKTLKTGVMLLSSCWKHYGMLLHLEDQKFSQHYKNLLDQYFSGIEVIYPIASCACLFWVECHFFFQIIVSFFYKKGFLFTWSDKRKLI